MSIGTGIALSSVRLPGGSGGGTPTPALDFSAAANSDYLYLLLEEWVM